MVVYAAYKGDTFLIVDTIDKVAEYLGVSHVTVKFYANPVYHRRIEGKDNSMREIKFDDEE